MSPAARLYSDAVLSSVLPDATSQCPTPSRALPTRRLCPLANKAAGSPSRQKKMGEKREGDAHLFSAVDEPLLHGGDALLLLHLLLDLRHLVVHLDVELNLLARQGPHPAHPQSASGADDDKPEKGLKRGCGKGSAREQVPRPDALDQHGDAVGAQASCGLANLSSVFVLSCALFAGVRSSSCSRGFRWGG